MNLHEAVATLPRSRDPYDVYVFLASHHVRGEPTNIVCCPVVVYLRHTADYNPIVVDYEGGDNTTVVIDQLTEEAIELPAGVAAFVHLLDNDPDRFPAVVAHVEEQDE